jgi:hypothetical protein
MSKLTVKSEWYRSCLTYVISRSWLVGWFGCSRRRIVWNTIIILLTESEFEYPFQPACQTVTGTGTCGKGVDEGVAGNSDSTADS